MNQASLSWRRSALLILISGLLIAGLMAKKMESFEAALLAVYYNGLAGNLAFKRVGLHMAATDLLESLPAAMKPFDKIVK